MANQTTEVTKSNPTDMAVNNKFINNLTEQLNQKKELGLSFPDNYSVANALNSAYLMLQETVDRDKKPVLASCTQQSIASSIMDMAVQALNPMKKQCYFVAYGGKLTLMRSYQGTMAVAKRVGAKKTPIAQIIYEGDTFTYHIENGNYVIDEHIQDFMNIDNAKIKGAYAIVESNDGTYVEVMNIGQIEKAWGKGFGYKKGSGVHEDFKDQMCKKTVINRACKNFINSSDDGYLTAAFDQTSDNEEIDGTIVDMEHAISQNANSEDFDEEFVQDVEIVETEVVIEDKPKQATKKESKEDLPDFLK